MAEVEVDLRRVFSECVANNKPYCCVCLRTYKEAPLGPNRRTMAVSAAIGGRAGWGLGAQACLTCEAAAGRALRFIRAVNAARATHDLFRILSRRNSPDKSAMKHCTELVCGARRAARLTATDVLIIDSYGVHTSSPMAETPTTLSSGGDVETVVLDDDDDARPPPPPAAPSAVPVPTLVTLDALLHARSLAPGAVAMLPDGTGVLARLAGPAGAVGGGVGSSNFVLHPTVVTRPDPPTLLVPTLGMQIVLPAGTVLPPRTGRVGTVVPVGGQPTQYLVTQKPQISVRSQNSLAATTDRHPSPEDDPLRATPPPHRNSAHRVHDAHHGNTHSPHTNNTHWAHKGAHPGNTHSPPKNNTHQMHNGAQLGNTHINNRRNKDRSPNNDETQKSKRNLNSLLKDNEEEAASKKVKYIVDIDTIEDMIKKKEGSMKQPVLKGDKIDWEDKIPMDVISFVDATDPNADDLFADQGGGGGGGGDTAESNVYPFGMICDVRTDAAPSTANVIDLC